MTSREQERRGEALRLMAAFADRTGVASGSSPRRYLWTDAFAVSNFVALSRHARERAFLELALKLVDQVHHTLGRHRPDDSRTGWISGLPEADGEAHPTQGGLRIGKRLPERRPSEPLNEVLEWERDGQYFHYLTQWMHALDQVTDATREPRFNRWARELAHTACEAFTRVVPGGGAHMAWKMSIDLSRAQVPAMGAQDPLDGLLAAAAIEATSRRLGLSHEGPPLERAMARYASMIESQGFFTTDPLGLGGLMVATYRLERLPREYQPGTAGELALRLLEAAARGLARAVQAGAVGGPAAGRLAFRELGLAIGMQAVARLGHEPVGERLASRLGALAPYLPLGADLEAFWSDPRRRQSPGWIAHEDINDVMLATSLLPDGYLGSVPVP